MVVNIYGNFLVLQCLFACVAYVYADVAPGRNQYLPPDKGYNYDKPNVPFLPSGQQPQQVSVIFCYFNIYYIIYNMLYDYEYV